MENINRQSSTYLITKEETKEQVIEKKASSTSSVSFKTLKLRKQVTWSEDTIDNEFMNRKKSKSNINIK